MAGAIAAFAALKHAPETTTSPHAGGKPVYAMPIHRPNMVKTFAYFMTGYALSWGVEVFDEDKIKDQAIQEATNVGLLTALLVTITASPLWSDPPSYLGDHANSINFYYLLFFMSTMLLAAGTLSAVLQMVVFSSLTGKQLRAFHGKAGVLMHLPFLFCVFGSFALAAAIMYCMYHASPTMGWWLFGMGVAAIIVVVFFGTATYFCQLLYDFHNEERLHPTGEQADSEEDTKNLAKIDDGSSAQQRPKAQARAGPEHPSTHSAPGLSQPSLAYIPSPASFHTGLGMPPMMGYNDPRFA